MQFSRRALIAGGLALAAAPVPALAKAKGDTQPLWLVRKGRARVYIYGNAGSPTPHWSAPRVEAAFAESAVFWKETPDQRPEDRNKFLRPGVDPAKPLTAWLTPAQRQTVEQACQEAGVTFASIAPVKPWLAAFSLTEAFGRRRAATTPGAPAEDPLPILTARAKGAAKPIRTEFPDIESQIAMLTTMSSEAQVEFLLYTIENSRLTQPAIDARRKAWAAGDLSLEEKQVAHLKRDYPNLYEPLEARRNAGWPARVQSMLDEGGTAFVLVGADHLVGPDSMLAYLARAGLKARRI